MTRIATLISISFATALACGTALAAPKRADGLVNPHPRAAPNFGLRPNVTRATGLPTWTNSWATGNTTYSITLIGNQPSTNTTTTIPTYIIPIKLVVAGKTFSPEEKLSNHQTVIQNIIDSPLFSTGIDFSAGGVSFGDSQYIDAYTRGNFGLALIFDPNWHTVFGNPIITTVQTIKVPSADGRIAAPFGINSPVVSYPWMQTQLPAILSKLNIPTNALPIFITAQTYLLNSDLSTGCCIGGYHTYTGTWTYAYATSALHANTYAEDVDVLSHELGEWQMDPFVNNNTPCGLLEVGDPLEGGANYGTYPYVLNGFTYHIQDLVMLPYFEDAQSDTPNNIYTFQGQSITACQNGQ